MHNLSRYYIHLFVNEFGQVEGKLNAISQTNETYISLSQNVVVDSFEKGDEIFEVKREIRFINSFRFVSSSLEKLASNLTSDQLVNMRKFYSDAKCFELLRKKGV